jgi:hypothetical protein
MISVLQNSGSVSEAKSYLMERIIRVKRTIPETERVELPSGYVDTANGWLEAEFEKLSKDSSTDSQIAILSGISARLYSIDNGVQQVEAATAAVRSKDEDKQKLNEILSRREYQKPEDKGQSLFQRWVNWFLEWLRNLFPKPDIPAVNEPSLQPLAIVIQVVIYALIIGLVGFLIYKFAPALMQRFGQKEKKDSSSRVILGEHIDASRSASDLFAEAERLASQGDLRSAIRRGYMALLCDLADRKVIGLARNKTNRDYLRDVGKRASLFLRMKSATRLFECYWYGFQQPREQDWDEFREQYHSAVKEA